MSPDHNDPAFFCSYLNPDFADLRSLVRLAPGQAFVALKTAKRDGHDYLGEALLAGASAAVVARAVPGVALPQLIVGDPLSALQAVAREHRKAFHETVVGIIRAREFRLLASSAA